MKLQNKYYVALQDAINIRKKWKLIKLSDPERIKQNQLRVQRKTIKKFIGGNMKEILITEGHGKYGIAVTEGEMVDLYITPSKEPEKIAAVLKKHYKKGVKVMASNKILKLAGLKEKIGRGDVIDGVKLPGIKITHELNTLMKVKAAKLGISLPEFRRKAYSELIHS